MLVHTGKLEFAWRILVVQHVYWVLSCKIGKILFLDICVHECNISKHDLARGLKKLHLAIRGHRGKVLSQRSKVICKSYFWHNKV